MSDHWVPSSRILIVLVKSPEQMCRYLIALVNWSEDFYELSKVEMSLESDPEAVTDFQSFSQTEQF